MAFFLFSALWTRKMNPALISEIMQAFWAYVKGNARTHPLTSHAVWPCRGFIIYELLPWGIGIKWTKKHMDRNTEKLNWCLNVKTHKHVLVWDFLGWDIYGLWLLLLLSYYACVKYPLLKLFELLIRIILIVEETIPVFLSSFNTQYRFLKILNICMGCLPACDPVCLSQP